MLMLLEHANNVIRKILRFPLRFPFGLNISLRLVIADGLSFFSGLGLGVDAGTFVLHDSVTSVAGRLRSLILGIWAAVGGWSLGPASG